MVALELLRRLVEVADVRRDPYAVAGICGGLLDGNPQDGHALAHYARALAALEMGAAARRMMALAIQAGGAPASAMDSLGRLPAGVVAWSSRRRRFQANLRAVAERGFGVEALQRAWDDGQEGEGGGQKYAERYELHQAADGNFHMLDRAAEALWKGWLGGFENHLAATAAIPAESFKSQLRAPLLLDGLGYGWLATHVLKSSDKSYLNYSAPIYMIEPDTIALCMVLHLHDLQEWLRGPLVRLFVGESARDACLKALQENASWTLPGLFAFSPLRPRAALKMQAGVEQILERRGEQRRAILQRVEKYYGAFDGAAWRRRYAEACAGGSPLRVLGITTRYSTVLRYSMEELQAAAGKCGIPMTMEVCMEPDDQSLEKDYLGMIERLKPDLLVTISRMRHEIPDMPRNIPALCWDQDNLQCMRESGAREDMRGLTFVAGHGAVFGSMHLMWPPEACIFCHPAGRTHHYQPGSVTAEEERGFGADVSYVSHASGTPEELRDTMRGKWKGNSGDLTPLFDTSCDEVLQLIRGGRSLEFLELRGLIRAQAERLGIALAEPVWHALLADLRLLADRAFRHETLGWVAQWCEKRQKRLRLWGNGWEKNAAFAKWAAGAALPGEQAMTVFRASAINLQIIETGVLHSRLLDGWAAGGFFLMRQAHRIQDEKRMTDCFRIGQLAEEESIQTLAALEARGSAELKELWKAIAGEYAASDRHRIFPGFRMWRALIPPQLLVPGLSEVMFRSAEEFERLADRYLASPDARNKMMGRIRDVLDQALSYDARWRDFVGHIAKHLGYGAAQEAATR